MKSSGNPLLPLELVKLGTGSDYTSDCFHQRPLDLVFLDRSKRLSDLWKGSKLVIFDKAGHTPHEEYPEKFNKLAIEFLSFTGSAS